MKRAFGLLTLVWVLMLMNPIQASAIGQPVFLGAFHQQGTALIPDCGTFQVIDVYQGELSITAFLDKDGYPDQAIIDFRGTDTFLNSATGKSFTESFHNKEFADLNAQSDLQPVKLTKVGVIYRLTVSGHGAVFLDVGKVVFIPGYVEFEAGKHQAVDGDLCGDGMILLSANIASGNIGEITTNLRRQRDDKHYDSHSPEPPTYDGHPIWDVYLSFLHFPTLL